jgi:FkbM family methyltransferase
MATKLCVNPTWNVFELCKDGICIDIGANNGGMTNSMLISGATKVYCIEPGSVNCEIIKNTYKNDSRVILFQTGVSDQKILLKNVTWLNAWVIGDPDVLKLPVSPGACDIEGYKRVDIELDTIDNIFKDIHDDIAFIKIDVDGYDYKALKGSINLINRCRPVIFIELSYYYDIIEENTVSKFILFVEENNYIFIDLLGNICSSQYIKDEFPYHSSCDIYLCPSEKIHMFKSYIKN